MEDMGPKPRINGSMLGTYQGKYVTLIGRAHDPDQNGMGFRLEICDGKDINVKLQEPLQELVEGAVQVQGLTDGKSLVNATYVDLPEGKNSFAYLNTTEGEMDTDIQLHVHQILETLPISDQKLQEVIRNTESAKWLHTDDEIQYLNQYDQAVRYLNSLQEVVIPQVPSMSQSQ